MNIDFGGNVFFSSNQMHKDGKVSDMSPDTHSLDVCQFVGICFVKVLTFLFLHIYFSTPVPSISLYLNLIVYRQVLK